MNFTTAIQIRRSEMGEVGRFTSVRVYIVTL